MHPAQEHTETKSIEVDSHTIYYHQSGNLTGQPVLFLHGGPGGGTSIHDARYFDPEYYRVILIDQRGSGLSTPTASLVDNTTWHLVEDIERIRVMLGIDRWIVFGGSWGSTLSLCYAITHPERVISLVLRGIFLLRPSELRFFYQDGASHIFPEYWEGFLAPIPQDERGDLMAAYHKYLTGTDEPKRLECALAWSTWECATSKLEPNKEYIAKAGDPHWALAFARIESHYFVNKGFLPTENFIIENAGKIQHIPTYIVQGRYDVVCPMRSAWQLHKALPHSVLEIVSFKLK